MAPLSGRRIVITRPREQAAGLRALLEEMGAEVMSFPVIEIAPLDDQSDLFAHQKRLADYDIAFFVSGNAVIHGLKGLSPESWPEQLRVATVGPGTAKALSDHGFKEVILPLARYDSEGVLALPEFQTPAIRGRSVLVFRGDGGRDLLVDTLRERGARVEVVACYSRRPARLDAAPLCTAFKAGVIGALVLSSSEGARFFVDIVGTLANEMLANLPVFVPHPRIADAAKHLGAKEVILTDAGDAGIASTIRQYMDCA